MRRASIGILVFTLAFVLSSAQVTAGESGTGFSANVRVFPDKLDRVAVVVDSDFDGSYERVVWATGRSAHGLPSDVVASLPLTLDDAFVSVTDDNAFRIAGSDAHGVSWEVVTKTSGEEPENFGVESREDRWVLHLENGAAVTTMTLPTHLLPGEATDLAIDQLRQLTGSFVTVDRKDGVVPGSGAASPLDDDDCDSGGAGSRSCSQECMYSGGLNGKIVGIGGGASGTMSQGCDVSCGAGYHSCCNCQFTVLRFFGNTIPILGASCLCVEDD